jgi:DNA-binding transcriptional LysR family regulator
MPRGAGVRTAFDLACAAQRIRPPITLVATAPAAITTLAGRGLGVGILSESSMPATVPPRQRRVLEDADVRVVLSLIWRHSGDAALRAFVTHAERAFGPQPKPGRWTQTAETFPSRRSGTNHIRATATKRP